MLGERAREADFISFMPPESKRNLRAPQAHVLQKVGQCGVESWLSVHVSLAAIFVSFQQAEQVHLTQKPHAVVCVFRCDF